MAFSVQGGSLFEALDPKEQGIFDAEFQNLVDSFLVERDFASVFLRGRSFLNNLAGRAKAELSEVFNGVLAQTGFGWGLIQPDQVGRTTTNVTNPTGATSGLISPNSWRRAPIATGFNDWLGSAATKNQINRDVGFIGIIGIGDYAPVPTAVATRFSIEGITHPVWDYQWAVRNGLRVWGLPEPQGIGSRSSFNLRLKDINTGGDETFLFGAIFARSQYLGKETPALDSP